MQTRQAIERIRAETILQVDRSLAQTRTAVERDLAARHDALIAVSRYLEQLQASQHDFETWLAELKFAAGSHASQIPPPPQWPAQPDRAQLAELSKPLDFAAPRVDAAASVALPNIAIRLPRLPELPDLRSIPDLGYAISQTDIAPAGDPRMARTFDHRWRCRGECVRPVCAGVRNHISLGRYALGRRRGPHR